MKKHLSTLERAISDVGYWSWWTDEVLPALFQVEFGGVQLWNPPLGEGKPPSGLIALRFRKPRLIYFLTFSEAAPPAWPDKMRHDKLEPFNIQYDAFTLSSVDLCKELLSKATQVRALLGTPGSTPLPTADEAFIGFDAHTVGLIVAAESMSVANHQGELDEAAIESSNQKWWAYWNEYWKCRETNQPMPRDYACEVCIPGKP